jgi:hypothetical protein
MAGAAVARVQMVLLRRAVRVLKAETAVLRALQLMAVVAAVVLNLKMAVMWRVLLRRGLMVVTERVLVFPVLLFLMRVVAVVVVSRRAVPLMMAVARALRRALQVQRVQTV